MLNVKGPAMLRANTTSALNILKVGGNALKRNHVLQISEYSSEGFENFKNLRARIFLSFSMLKALRCSYKYMNE